MAIVPGLPLLANSCDLVVTPLVTCGSINRDVLAGAASDTSPTYFVPLGNIDSHRSDILEIPFLAENVCEHLVSMAEDSEFLKPKSSDGRFGAEEVIVRSLCPNFEILLVKAVTEFLGPIFWQKWAFYPTQFSPPFITRYTADKTPGIPLHHDYQSHVSVTIPLNNKFTGGGIHFPRQRILTGHDKVGTAIVFPGRVTHPHEALPVLTGTRYILTLWTRHNAKGDGAE